MEKKKLSKKELKELRKYLAAFYHPASENTFENPLDNRGDEWYTYLKGDRQL